MVVVLTELGRSLELSGTAIFISANPSARKLGQEAEHRKAVILEGLPCEQVRKQGAELEREGVSRML